MATALAGVRAAEEGYIAHYNFCRVHEALRCTPAMAVGATDHIWTLAALISAGITIAAHGGF